MFPRIMQGLSPSGQHQLQGDFLDRNQQRRGAEIAIVLGTGEDSARFLVALDQQGVVEAPEDELRGELGLPGHREPDTGRIESRVESRVPQRHRGNGQRSF